MSCRILLRCVGMAVLDKGLRGLLKETPFAGYLIDIATSAYDHFQRECRENREFQAIQSKVDKTLDAVSDGASKAFANIQKQSNPENKGSVELREIESAACATMDEIKVEAREVLAEIRRQAAPELRAKLDDPILQNNMLGYLEQIPGTVRASLKRPSDPSGKSLPKGFALSSADDFLKILPTQPPRFKAGDMPVGNWKLLDLLGVGGFGEVWKAEHPSLKGIPPVALKFCLSPDSARFLRHEGELLSRVMEVSANNPGIVKLRQAYIESDTPCLEYEFINGGDLCGLMSEWLNMPKERRTLLALQMLLKLARTIAPLHTMNPPIVHRDLKPANVLVVRTADGKINLKIGDFGIGGLATKQAIEGQSKGASQGEILTQTLRGSHTPLYAGPEQQRGDPPHPTDDVHALGVIGFQLLVCDLRRGPTGDWDEELRELGVSDPIIAMFKQCIARQARRYPHAGALADELQNLIDSKPSTAAKPALPVPPVPAAIQVNPFNDFTPISSPAPSKSTHRPTTKNDKAKSLKKPSNYLPMMIIGTAFTLILIGTLILSGFRSKNTLPAASPSTQSNLSGKTEVTQWSQAEPSNPAKVGTKLPKDINIPQSPMSRKTAQTKQEQTTEKSKIDALPAQWKSLASNFDDLDKHWIKGDNRGNFSYNTNTKTISLDTPHDLGTIIYAGTWTVLYFELFSDKLSFDRLDLEINGNTLKIGSFVKHNVWQKIRIVYENETRSLNASINNINVANATVLKPLIGGLNCKLNSGGGQNAIVKLKEIQVWTGSEPRIALELSSSTLSQSGKNSNSKFTIEPKTQLPMPPEATISSAKIRLNRIGDTILIPLKGSIKLTFAWVPPGDSWLGGGGGIEGAKLFSVKKGFWCSQYEVTQEQWQAVIGNNPSHFNDKPNNPVEMVSWNDVQTFLEKVNALNLGNGFHYQLPTSDEWEYIIRGGPISKSQSKYHFYFARSKMDLSPIATNNLSSLQANFNGNMPFGNGILGPLLQTTCSVGNYLPNPLGVYDMHGNVTEWRSDDENGNRVFGGGSWLHYGDFCLANHRVTRSPSTSGNHIGFRLIAVPLGE